jgi:molybdenum cofactor cytidylyltransferase
MISAIVLAAGKSARMGAINKMLLPFKGSTVIGTVLRELQQSLVDEIIIVDNQNLHIKEHLNEFPSVNFATNLIDDGGLASSIQCGVHVANDSTTGFLICLGDMPLLTSEDYNSLINKLIRTKSKVIVLPTHNNKRGNPVLFSADFRQEILELKDGNGCKPVVMANRTYILEVPYSSNSCHVDIDTVEDYKNLSK